MPIWESFTNQKQWKTYLQNLIKTNDKALLKSIVLIYDNQTEDEKEIGSSVEDNRIGFSKWDAEEMSFIAKRIKNGEALNQNMIVHARHIMPKYWKQLMKISKNNLEKLVAEKELYEESIMTKEEIELCLKREEELRQCLEEGKACSYGICDECPNVLKIN